MKTVGYCLTPQPELASYRLRVSIPARHIGRPYFIGKSGDVNFFYKDGSPQLAESLHSPIVYDVVNDHFSSKPSYGEMCLLADVITCGSEAMAETVYKRTGRRAEVIDDPYENDESEAQCKGHDVLWFGHGANLPSLGCYAGLPNLKVCSGRDWSLEAERLALAQCALVLLTSTNPGASSNRVVKALRAGRFVIAPSVPQSWTQFADFIWIGDVEEGIAWALNNREEACQKVIAGQKYTRERFAPSWIGAQWARLFASISDQATSVRKVG